MKAQAYHAVRFYDYPYIDSCDHLDYLADYNKQLKDMDTGVRAIAATIMDFTEKYGELYCDIIFIIEEDEVK